MKLAVFSDATCHPTLKRSAIATVGYDITDPHHPREIFTHGVCIPYCDATVGESQAVVLALEQVLLRIEHGGISPEMLSLFTDAEAVYTAIERHRLGKTVRPVDAAVHIEAFAEKQRQLSMKGCPLGVEVISRKFNKRANQLAHQAFNACDPVLRMKGNVHERHPFLKILNETL